MSMFELELDILVKELSLATGLVSLDWAIGVKELSFHSDLLNSNKLLKVRSN